MISRNVFGLFHSILYTQTAVIWLAGLGGGDGYPLNSPPPPPLPRIFPLFYILKWDLEAVVDFAYQCYH